MRHIFLLVLVCLLASTGWAQSTNATLSGRVVDSSQAILANADVLLINTETGARISTKTNSQGFYVLPNIAPGKYELEVSRTGFKTIAQPNLVLHVQDVSYVNFTLPVGSVSEVVTVTGSTSMIDTTDASVSTVVDQTFVKNMPLNGRSFQDLILLTPGTITQSPQASGAGTGLGMTGEFSINGQRTEANYYTVDGVSANVGTFGGGIGLQGAGPSGSVPASTALGTTQALVSVDELQEFRVQSSTYSAEYGRNPGGQLAFETKSGTNQWHGTAYDYLRNGFFDANDWFNDYFGLKEPVLRQNDFGGTLGGPVRIPGLYNGKDKTFFFFNYEGLRLSAPQAAVVNYVPDAALRASAPSPLNQALNAFPVPNGKDDPANGIAQFIGTWSNPASIDSTSVRLDHVFKERHRLFFRFSDTQSNSSVHGVYTQNETTSSNQITSYTTRTYTSGVTSLVTNRLSNDLRLNYSSNFTTNDFAVDPIAGSAPVDLGQLSGTSGATVELQYGGYQVQLQQLPLSGAQRQWNLVDTVSLSSGRHQFKFGADFRRLTPFAVPSPTYVNYYYFDPSAVTSNSAFISTIANASSYPLNKNLSAFAQDDWKLSSRLTLSMGLRWDVNPAPSVTQGQKPYTVSAQGPITNWSLAPLGAPLWHTAWYNFAPRLGAAYVLRASQGWETVLRGGGGVFFDTGQQLASSAFQLGPGFQATNNFAGSFPVTSGQIPTIGPPMPQTYEGYGFASHLQLPYTIQWNTSVEQALGKSQALTLSYVGAHASRLLQQNLYIDLTFTNPNTCCFFIVQNGLTSDYDSAQVQFQRRLSKGLTALASYTWAHAIDYGSENYQLGYQRGNSDLDVRHNFSGAFSYDLPSLGTSPVLNAILGHWGVDDRFIARTAFPVTLFGTGQFQPDGKIYDEGLSIVPGQPIYVYGAQCAAIYATDFQSTLPCPGGRAINPDAFSNVSSGYGNAPRNFIRGFGAWQMNLAVRREFPIHDRLTLQFRAEAFNMFNHPNLGTISPDCSNFNGTPGCLNPQFGQATATLASSLGTLNPLFQMGGPRSMQFALKLIF